MLNRRKFLKGILATGLSLRNLSCLFKLPIGKAFIADDNITKLSPTIFRPRIKVFGIGCAGTNAVNRMVDEPIVETPGFVDVKDTSELHVEMVQDNKSLKIAKDNKVHECNGFQMKYDDMGNKTIISFSVKDSQKIDLNAGASATYVQVGPDESDDALGLVGGTGLKKTVNKTSVIWTKTP